MFCGSDVANALGYSNTRKAIRDHVNEEDKTRNDSFLVNGTSPILINESGLYSLILSSKLDSAKRFKHWVTFSMPTMHAADVEKIYTPTTSGVQLMTYVDGVRQAIYSWTNGELKQYRDSQQTTDNARANERNKSSLLISQRRRDMLASVATKKTLVFPRSRDIVALQPSINEVNSQQTTDF